MDHTEYITNRRPAITLRSRAAIGPLLALVCLVVGLWNVSSPPLWWDEGWTLSVARNWVEQGHYGRLLAGHLAPSGLEASFPTTAAVALSFRLFGVGIWQGRLVGVLFTVAALVVLYDLARRLYSREVAVATLAIVLLLSMLPDLHPLILGRQVLAEMPMMFFLLAGYTCFFLALHRSPWFLPLAMGLWGLALITKAQVMPFWRVSLLVPLVVALPTRQWKTAVLLGVALLGSPIVSEWLVRLQGLILQGHILPADPVEGLVNLLALVPFSPVRPAVLVIALLFGLPTLLGLCYATWQWLESLRNRAPTDSRDVVRLVLLALAGSWFAWYTLLSAGFPRYLFPPVFVGSIFVAVLLDALTDHFSLSSLKPGGSRSSRRGLDRGSPRRLLTMVLIAVPLPFTLVALYRNYTMDANAALFEAVRFLNVETPPDALIETYDTELHFLLHRRYHYPPDQVHVELNRRLVVDPNQPIDYDPLAADPDYLVVGPFVRDWRLYDPILATDAFRLLREYGEYDIYERVR
ncbi:MAG TPA: glycosyltransferase family 39 protein [Herpetosiphonaceae bacterium]|nr:glycosyltransferase family 39 protein [Herpetosiphonaceae bacterium]